MSGVCVTWLHSLKVWKLKRGRCTVRWIFFFRIRKKMNQFFFFLIKSNVIDDESTMKIQFRLFYEPIVDFFQHFFLLCSPLCSVVHHRCERFSCRPYVEEPKRFQSVVSVLQSSLGNKKKTFDMKFTKIRYEWLYVISYLDSLKNESILISYHKQFFLT